MTGKYVYGFSDDYFASDYFDTPKEALEEARKINAIYIGVVGEKWKPEIEGEGIIDMLRENAYSDCNAKNYLDNVTDEEIKELTEELTAAFERWAEKNGHTVDFYTVDDIREYKL